MRASCCFCSLPWLPNHFAWGRRPVRRSPPISPETPRTAAVTPQTIFFNGTIYTGEGLAEDKPRTVQAMAIGGGKVLAVGTNEEIKRLAGPDTQVRDLNAGGTGVFVFPGFNDAHTHLGMAAQHQIERGSERREIAGRDAGRRLQPLPKAQPAGHWLTGGGWDHTLWAHKTLPTRQDLDKVTGGHPGVSCAHRRPHRSREFRGAESGRHHRKDGCRRRAGRSTWMQVASLPGFCAKRRRSWLRR